MATTVLPGSRDDAAPPVPQAASPRAQAWSPPAVAAAVIAVALVVAAHLVLMARLRAPVIHPDEYGYLQNAHYLARGGLRPTTEYYPGYSLLLVPLWWFSRDPVTVWRGALVVNAAVAGLGAVFAWCLLGRLAPRLGRWWRALVVVVTVAYPPLVLYSDFAMSESAFATAFLGVCLVAARAFEPTAAAADAARPRWAPWAALGVACGLLALVHPRGFAVGVAAALLGLVVLARSGRRAAVPLAALGAGLAAGFVATRALVVALKDPASRFGAYSPSNILSRATTIHGLLSLMSEAGGQLFYLSVVSLGLVPLGLWLALKSLRACLGGDRNATVVARAFAGLAFLGVWAVSSLFMNLGTRADKLIYGRYNDAAVAPLLLIALADVLHPAAGGKDRRLHGRVRPRAAVGAWVVIGGGVLLASAAFVGLGHPGSQLHGPLNPANVIGIVPLIHHMGGKVEVVALTAIAIAGVLVGAVLAIRWPVVAAGAILGAFVWATVTTQTTYILPGSRARAAENVVPTTLAALRRSTGADLSCVAWDNTAIDDFNLYATEFLLPDQRIEPYTVPAGKPCGPLVVSPDAGFAARYPGARMVTRDPYAGVALWALPGTTADRLAAAGWLFEAGGPKGLPDSARVDDLALASTVPSIRSGETGIVRVAATHPAGGEPWPTIQTFPGGSYAVRLSIRWDAPPGVLVPTTCPAPPTGGAAPIACPNMELPQVALPGATVTIPAVLTARSSTGQPLPPGTYTVRIGLYQEGVYSFTDHGVTQITVLVTAP